VDCVRKIVLRNGSWSRYFKQEKPQRVSLRPGRTYISASWSLSVSLYEYIKLCISKNSDVLTSWYKRECTFLQKAKRVSVDLQNLLNFCETCV